MTTLSDFSVSLRKFFANFRNNFVSCDLIRIGGEGDGGYLLPNVLGDVKYCFSPGVGDLAKFEEELARTYGIKSFMADASVAAIPIANENFEFIPKFLAHKTEGKFITLSDWVQMSIGESTEPKILQMDIEGGEFPVLMCEPRKLLGSFSILAIEFHGLERLNDPRFLKLLTAIFDKIYLDFSICHVHPNNCCGIVLVDGEAVPRVMEVTFVRNDLLEKCKSEKPVSLPNPLDRKNVPSSPDIIMPEIWWRR